MSSAGTWQGRVAALTGVAIALQLVTAVGYAGLHRGTRHAAASPRSATAAPAPSQAVVTALLQRRSRAVLTRDRAAFLATVDPSAQAFRAGQETLFDNLAKVPLATWRESLADTRAAAAADDGWTARLTLTYRLRGFDTGDVAYTRYLTFERRRDTGWVVSGDGSAHGLRDDPQIWDGPDLTVVRGRYTLVLGAGGTAVGDGTGAADGGETRTAELRDIARRLDTGVGLVSKVVGGRWARRVVALAPATEQRAEELVGSVRNLGDIAALATVSGGAGDPRGGADRVVITPTAFGRLNGLGRRVVLTHELVHVAMGGARDSRTPMWLVEGLADYVGYKDAGVPTRAAGRELAGLISSEGLPAAPPGRDAFTGSGERLSAAYEEAWLACRMIAERYGEGRLVRLYRTAEAEPGTAGDPRIEDRALRAVLGVDSSRFAAQWRAYLRKELM
ncbi:hypothetical protein NE235_06060 [Actinoallomurus spadix]|uniref:Uncharacterized protein n=1 Tax=Actinoallomurus spadix TaxID=79912 RepID=A0ABN0W4S3_9ACTN|nr:hypothetical protein [Actinoallomurus spadix]MCO5985669.1 hypothetical protein [Actinoallomurus spadix]